MEKFLLSSLIPFIDKGEISYYAQFTEEILLYLISLAPFVNNAKNLHKLSNLSLADLEKASEVLPIMNFNEIEDYFNKI